MANWMILLMPEKKLVGDVWGDGCRHCRFLNTLKLRAECICDDLEFYERKYKEAIAHEQAVDAVQQRD